MSEAAKKANVVWGGKIIRSYPRTITVKSTGEKRDLREIVIACTPDAYTHKASVDKDTFEKGLTGKIDTLRVSIWADDQNYEDACSTKPGHSIMVHSGKVVLSNEGYVNCSVKKFIFCDDPSVSYFKMPDIIQA